jgi:hypothetical protein
MCSTTRHRPPTRARRFSVLFFDGLGDVVWLIHFLPLELKSEAYYIRLSEYKYGQTNCQPDVSSFLG